jgi:phosphoribosylformimino-5-aminoimidazole carboxamide ribotide isomerase
MGAGFMIVIPAIDLYQGECVRLRHGKLEEKTVYSKDPVAMAQKWVAAGAERLHVVDLDGAFTGEPKNLDWIVKIKKATNITVQMGGGLRSMDVIDRILSTGIDRVILGTVAMEEAGLAQSAFEKYPGRVMVALDVKDGRVAVRGWKGDSGVPALEALSIVEKLGAKEVIYTDISRDGTLEGVNLKGFSDMINATSMAIVASGGVTTLQDIVRLKTLGTPACIVGKAIYEEKIKLSEAIAIAKN